jgi:hypothetical protein
MHTSSTPTDIFSLSIEERAKRLGVPVIRPMRRYVTPTMPTNPVVAICGECGRDVYMIEGYSCSHNDCPIQPKFS